MRFVRRALASTVGIFVGCVVACASGPAGTIVIGLEGDDVVAVGSIHAGVLVDGVKKASLDFPNASSPQMLPQEIVADGADGDPVFVSVSRTSDASEIRTATTTIVGGEKLLLRLHLEARCVLNNGSAPPPTCYPPQTCIAGSCASRSVSPAQLEPYSADWATKSKPGCGSAGAPEIALVDSSSKKPLVDGDVLTIVRGLQGGIHIELTVVAKNVPRASHAKIKLWVPDNQVVLDEGDIPFAFASDGTQCVLDAIRLNPAKAANEAAALYGEFALRGHAVDATLTVRQPDGTTTDRVYHLQIN